MRLYSPKLVWEPAPYSVMAAVERATGLWAGTPYESGQSFVGRGADCLGSVFGVVDEMDGRKRAQHPGMPGDTALHNRKAAVLSMRHLMRLYAPSEKVEGPLVQPGDIVVTGGPGGGPGHVEIVGAGKNHLWHAVRGSGFHQGGWSFLEQQVLFAVYRIGDRERWR